MKASRPPVSGSVRKANHTVENDNILAVNIANGVSILIMAIVGFFLLGLLRKAVTGKAANVNPLSSEMGSVGNMPQMGAY